MSPPAAREEWLRVAASEGARTAVVLGPVDGVATVEELLRTYPGGLFWIVSTDERLRTGVQHARLLSLAVEVASDARLGHALGEFLALDYHAFPAVYVSARVEESAHAARYARAVDEVVEGIETTRRARRTRFENGPLQAANTFHNLPGYLRHPLPESWRGCARGRVALVVGAGPSLDETLPKVARWAFHPLVLSTDSALRACEATGLRPALVVSLDPEKRFSACAPPGYREGLALLGSEAHPSWSRRWEGRAMYLSGRNVCEDFLEQRGLERPPCEAVNNVGRTALALADFLGAEAIVLVGLDLAHGRPCNSGQARYGRLTGRQGVRLAGKGLFQVPGNFAESVPTAFFSDWSETSALCAEVATRRPLVNFTDRGAVLEGATVVTPDKADELEEALAAAHHADGPLPWEASQELPAREVPPVLLRQLGGLLDEVRAVIEALPPVGKGAAEKLAALRALLVRDEISGLFGPFSFALMAELVRPDPLPVALLDHRLSELRALVARCEDALLYAAGETSLQRERLFGVP